MRVVCLVEELVVFSTSGLQCKSEKCGGLGSSHVQPLFPIRIGLPSSASSVYRIHNPGYLQTFKRSTTTQAHPDEPYNLKYVILEETPVS